MVVLYNVLLKWSQWLGDVQSCSRSQCRISGCLFCNRQTTSWISHKTTPPQHIHTQPFNGRWSGTTQVGQYKKKHSPTHIHPDHPTSFINFLHLLRYVATSLFSLRAWQSSRTTSLQVIFGLPLGLGPSTSYSMHFFTQSSSSFCSTCPYQRSLFCCNTLQNCNKFYTSDWIAPQRVVIITMSTAICSLGHGLCNYRSG